MTNTVAKKFFDGKTLGLLSGSIDRFKGITITSNVKEF